jgi:hypothetical protein
MSSLVAPQHGDLFSPQANTCWTLSTPCWLEPVRQYKSKKPATSPSQRSDKQEIDGGALLRLPTCDFPLQYD